MGNNIEKISFLNNILGLHKFSGDDNVEFHCPFCRHRKPKLGVSLDYGYWYCWVCKSKGRTIQSLLKKINCAPDYLDRSRTLWKGSKQKSTTKSVSISLPNEYRPLWVKYDSFLYRKSLRYLLNRNVTAKDIVKHSIGYCQEGKYDGMLVFPNYSESGELTYYSARSYDQDAARKFLTPPVPKNHLIGDDLMIDWQSPLILVESKLDAIVVKRNAIPLYGKSISEGLKIKILENGITDIYICLDGDALDDIIKCSDFFVKNGITIWKVNLPENDDPSSLGHDLVWEYINKSEKITPSQIFDFKIKQKMKL